MSLSSERYSRDVNECMPSFAVISLHVSILSGIKGIHGGKWDLRDDVVSNDIGV